MKKTILFTAIILLVSCTNSEKAIKVLTDEGYTNIETTGYAPFMCSKDDAYKTGFKATNKNGRRVSGAVCGGIMKGYTIRLN